MYELLLVITVTEHLHEALRVADVLEQDEVTEQRRTGRHLQVRVVRQHPTVLHELDHARLGQGVEVGAEQELDRLLAGLLVAGPETVAEVLHDLPQLLHQHHRLDQLHIAELRIPVDVRRAHQDSLGYVLHNRLSVGIITLHCSQQLASRGSSWHCAQGEGSGCQL